MFCGFKCDVCRLITRARGPSGKSGSRNGRGVGGCWNDESSVRVEDISPPSFSLRADGRGRGGAIHRGRARGGTRGTEFQPKALLGWNGYGEGSANFSQLREERLGVRAAKGRRRSNAKPGGRGGGHKRKRGTKRKKKEIVVLDDDHSEDDSD